MAFRREMDAVFGRAWLPVAHGGDLTELGSYLATTVGSHDIFLVRGRDVGISRSTAGQVGSSRCSRSNRRE